MYCEKGLIKIIVLYLDSNFNLVSCQVSDRVKLVVKKCIPYAHACRDQGKSCSAIPTSVCNHLKQHISSSEGMNVKIPDLPSGSSWSGHTKISSSVDGIVTLRNVQQSLQAFIAFV